MYINYYPPCLPPLITHLHRTHYVVKTIKIIEETEYIQSIPYQPYQPYNIFFKNICNLQNTSIDVQA